MNNNRNSDNITEELRSIIDRVGVTREKIRLSIAKLKAQKADLEDQMMNKNRELVRNEISDNGESAGQNKAEIAALRRKVEEVTNLLTAYEDELETGLHLEKDDIDRLKHLVNLDKENSFSKAKSMYELIEAKREDISKITKEIEGIEEDLRKVEWARKDTIQRIRDVAHHIEPRLTELSSEGFTDHAQLFARYFYLNDHENLRRLLTGDREL